MFKIKEVQDISRPRCKRFVAHIEVDTDSKDVVKNEIVKATSFIKTSDDYSKEITKQKFEGFAHVVRLYVYQGGKLICQSMWVDKELKDAPLPLPLQYNDSINDIGIVWS